MTAASTLLAVMNSPQGLYKVLNPVPEEPCRTLEQEK